MVHANDNLGERDDHLPPGKGLIDWKQLLQKLDATGFKGGMILEFSGDRPGPPGGVLEEARRARRYLRSISRRIGISIPPTVPSIGPPGAGPE